MPRSALLGSLMIAALCLPMSACTADHPAGVTRWPTPAWGRPGNLRLRLVDGAAAAAATPQAAPGAVPVGLLLRRDAGAVYRYDAQRNMLLPVATALWDEVSTAVADCASQVPATAVRINTSTGQATLAGQLIALAGSDVVTTLKSPSGRLAALVSAGAPRRSLMPLLGGGHSGPFHHQVLRLDDGRLLPPAVQLPFDKSEAGLTACWSADERFVVYANLIMTVVVIVAIEAEGNLR